MKGSDFLIDSDGEIETLCDFTSGFIQGRLSKIMDPSENVVVTETNCQSMGSPYCEFKVVLD